MNSSPLHEVVREVVTEVKFRKSIKADHTIGLRHFKRRYASPLGVLVTRESTLWNPVEGILSLPLQSFLLAF